MSKQLLIFFCLVFIGFLIFIPTRNIIAADCSLIPSKSITKNDSTILSVKTKNSGCLITPREDPKIEYTVVAYPRSWDGGNRLNSCGAVYCTYFTTKVKPIDSQSIAFKFEFGAGNTEADRPGKWIIKICRAQASATTCATSNSNTEVIGKGEILISPDPTTTPPPDLPIIDRITQSQCGFRQGDNSSPGTIDKVTNIKPDKWYHWWWQNKVYSLKGPISEVVLKESLTDPLRINIPVSNQSDKGNDLFCVDIYPYKRTGENCIPIKFTAGPPSDEDKACKLATTSSSSCTPGQPNCISSAGISCNTNNGNLTYTELGKDSATNKDILIYKDAKTGDIVNTNDLGVFTAIGCVPTNPTKLIEGLLKFATFTGGGIALLLFLAGVFQMITSAGNPDGVKKGSEQMTAAIIGLLFIIFSVMLLKVIGVDILQIPGFQ